LNGFKKLVIENFQSHQYTEIDFTDGLNVFVGPSDSGKSAILRALKWVLFNTPRGTDFIRTGAKECRVRLVLTDGTAIERIRSRSVNRYVLNTPDGKEQIFEGFGNSVPEEISDVHRIVPVELDQKELLLNFGTQLESPFLLFESNQNKAKTIGRISGAHLIDKALKKTSTDRLALSGTIRQLEQEKERLDEKLKPYENLQQLEADFQVAERAFLDVQEKKRLQASLEAKLESLIEIRRGKEVWQEKVAALKRLPDAEQQLLHLEYQKAMLSRLIRLNEKWIRLQQEKERTLETVKQGEHIPEAERRLAGLSRSQKRFEQLLRLQNKRNQIKEKKAGLETFVLRLKNVPQGMRELEKLAEKHERFKVLQPLKRRKEKNARELKYWRQVQKQNQEALEVLEKVVPNIEEKEALKKKLNDLHQSRLDCQKRIAIGKKYIREKEQEILHCTREWIRLLKKIGKCPTCGTPIGHSVLQHIMEEYQGGISRAAAGRED
jgi:DNA repair protein SbcC/Rad50